MILKAATHDFRALIKRFENQVCSERVFLLHRQFHFPFFYCIHFQYLGEGPALALPHPHESFLTNSDDLG